jgi:hypothetical protein
MYFRFAIYSQSRFAESNKAFLLLLISLPPPPMPPPDLNLADRRSLSTRIDAYRRHLEEGLGEEELSDHAPDGIHEGKIYIF